MRNSPLDLEPQTSTFVTLAERLTDEVMGFREAERQLSRLRERYSMEGPPKPPPEVAKYQRSQAVRLAQTVRHVRAVEDLKRRDFVLLPRGVCSEGNALHRVKHRVPRQPLDVLRTRSTILCNSDSVRLAYLPVPSNEVLVYSPILAHA